MKQDEQPVNNNPKEDESSEEKRNRVLNEASIDDGFIQVPSESE